MWVDWYWCQCVEKSKCFFPCLKTGFCKLSPLSLSFPWTDGMISRNTVMQCWSQLCSVIEPQMGVSSVWSLFQQTCSQTVTERGWYLIEVSFYLHQGMQIEFSQLGIWTLRMTGTVADCSYQEAGAMYKTLSGSSRM